MEAFCKTKAKGSWTANADPEAQAWRTWGPKDQGSGEGQRDWRLPRLGGPQTYSRKLHLCPPQGERRCRHGRRAHGGH